MEHHEHRCSTDTGRRMARLVSRTRSGRTTGRMPLRRWNASSNGTGNVRMPRQQIMADDLTVMPTIGVSRSWAFSFLSPLTIMERNHDGLKLRDGLIEEIVDAASERLRKTALGRELKPDEAAVINDMAHDIVGRIRAAVGAEAYRTAVTPPELARMWGISPDKVLSWIRSGELQAINIASDRRLRPRYVIEKSAVEAFARSRETVRGCRSKSRKNARRSDVVEFF